MEKTTFKKTQETAWCPGCGNFSIWDTMVKVLNELEANPSDVLLVGGIGQAAKTNQYVNANGFSGLHGRALPAAVGAKIANKNLMVIVNTGDGDSYGEGGNHFLHNIRRNVDITHFVHDNQIYGLTKGQISPTSNVCDEGMLEKGMQCNVDAALNPMTIAIAAGAGFVARGFSGRPAHLAQIMKAAILHEGYALVDILQPCVSFNKHNTYQYYQQRVYELDDSYDSGNREAALVKSMEFDDRIPLGILYKADRPDYQANRSSLYGAQPLVDGRVTPEQLKALLNLQV